MNWKGSTDSSSNSSSNDRWLARKQITLMQMQAETEKNETHKCKNTINTKIYNYSHNWLHTCIYCAHLHLLYQTNNLNMMKSLLLPFCVVKPLISIFQMSAKLLPVYNVTNLYTGNLVLLTDSTAEYWVLINSIGSSATIWKRVWSATTHKASHIHLVWDMSHQQLESLTDLLERRLRSRPSIFMTTSTSESARRRNRSSLPRAQSTCDLNFCSQLNVMFYSKQQARQPEEVT